MFRVATRHWSVHTQDCYPDVSLELSTTVIDFSISTRSLTFTWNILWPQLWLTSRRQILLQHMTQDILKHSKVLDRRLLKETRFLIIMQIKENMSQQQMRLMAFPPDTLGCDALYLHRMTQKQANSLGLEGSQDCKPVRSIPRTLVLKRYLDLRYYHSTEMATTNKMELFVSAPPHISNKLPFQR